MCTRPRRSALKQKDASIDMLGLSRQEERMLQRAMYDSLRQNQSQRGGGLGAASTFSTGSVRKRKTLSAKASRAPNPITTRSKTLSKKLLTLAVPQHSALRTAAAVAGGVAHAASHDRSGSSNGNSNNGNVVSDVTSPCCFAKPPMKLLSPFSSSSSSLVVEAERKLKRGTRYSPMRRVPLREMLKSLEDKKNHFTNDRITVSISSGGGGATGTSSLATKRQHCASSLSSLSSPSAAGGGGYAAGDVLRMDEVGPTKSAKTESVTVPAPVVGRRPGRPKLFRPESTNCPSQSGASAAVASTLKQSSPAKMSSSGRRTHQMSPKTKRVPRTASLLARSSWIRSYYGSSHHGSNASSPNGSLPVKVANQLMLLSSSTSPSCNGIGPGSGDRPSVRSRLYRRGRGGGAGTGATRAGTVEGRPVLQKRKKLIYNRKRISRSQRISRVILATATQRFKKARIKRERNSDDTKPYHHQNHLHNRNSALTSSASTKFKSSSGKLGQDVKATAANAVIPPELWLDPKGKPVNTEDFINFLIYKDTPFLDKSLKWFSLPPHKRKQRLYKIVPVETTKFNETVVYSEKREGGGREVVVQCQPPKFNDDSSELVSIDSDQTSLLEESKAKCPASVNSSCVTQAAVDDQCSPIKCLQNGPCGVKMEVGEVEKEKSHRVKKIIKSCPKSTHIMEIRKRKA